jgi:acyl carrier protein
MSHAQLVKSSIAKRVYVPVDQVRDEMKLADFALDSFALVELIIELEETSGIHLSTVDLADLGTVGQLTALIERKAASHDCGMAAA